MIDSIIADAAAELADRITKQFTSQEWLTSDESERLFEVAEKQAVSVMTEIFKPLV